MKFQLTLVLIVGFFGGLFTSEAIYTHSLLKAILAILNIGVAILFIYNKREEKKEGN